MIQFKFLIANGHSYVYEETSIPNTRAEHDLFHEIDYLKTKSTVSGCPSLSVFC